MKQLRSAVTYSNVVATLALFLAVSGGVVYAASSLGRNSVKSTNIAAHAVKTRNLAKNAVKKGNLAANAVTTAKVKKAAITGAKVKGGSLTRTNLAAGTLAGLQVLDAGNGAVPGLTEFKEGGTQVPLSGTTSFTPVAGKSYELLTELKGTPTDANGSLEGSCFASVRILVNGAPFTGAFIYNDAEEKPPFNNEPVGSSSTAIGMQEAGQPQSISALAFGNNNCSPATTASLRVTVVEFG
ncbi:MAG TPA: hypothetical protein VFX35_06065 [Solirubrobacterales bacterium]|nr:hypothetical protein [Solirubrobacterales bacterium]